MSLAEIRLDDKYRLATGHLYLTGTQASAAGTRTGEIAQPA